MADDFDELQVGLNSPGEKFAAIVPDDNTDLAFTPRGIYVGQTGDIEAVDAEGNTVIFVNATAGTVLPIRPVRIKAANTSAMDLIGLR
jgi:hypothetical protein